MESGMFLIQLSVADQKENSACVTAHPEVGELEVLLWEAWRPATTVP
jgi:hypothetical protein